MRHQIALIPALILLLVCVPAHAQTIVSLAGDGDHFGYGVGNGVRDPRPPDAARCRISGPGSLPMLDGSARTRIVPDSSAPEVAKRAWPQGLIATPMVTYLPCSARRGALLTIVETIVDESTKSFSAASWLERMGPDVDATIGDCLRNARLSPRSTNGRRVTVVFHMTVSGRS